MLAARGSRTTALPGLTRGNVVTQDNNIDPLAANMHADLEAETQRTLREANAAAEGTLMTPAAPALSAAAPAPLPPSGWYEAPGDPTQFRYWDGLVWTDHFSPRIAPTVVRQALVEQPMERKLRGRDRWLGRTTERLEAKAQRVEREPSTPTVTRNKRRAAAQQTPSLAEMVNRLQREAPRQPLDEQVEVVGETYYVKGIKQAFRELGVPITAKGATLESVECVLVPEPWNSHDENAVAIMVGTHHVGYLPADMAVDYAEGLGALANAGFLATGEGRLWAKDEGSGMVRARVTILIPPADAFD